MADATIAKTGAENALPLIDVKKLWTPAARWVAISYNRQLEAYAKADFALGEILGGKAKKVYSLSNGTLLAAKDMMEGAGRLLAVSQGGADNVIVQNDRGEDIVKSKTEVLRAVMPGLKQAVEKFKKTKGQIDPAHQAGLVLLDKGRKRLGRVSNRLTTAGKIGLCGGKEAVVAQIEAAKKYFENRPGYEERKSAASNFAMACQGASLTEQQMEVAAYSRGTVLDEPRRVNLTLTPAGNLA